MTKPYTTAMFEKVRIAREKELREIEEREKKNGEKEIEAKINAGVREAMLLFGAFGVVVFLCIQRLFLRMVK